MSAAAEIIVALFAALGLVLLFVFVRRSIQAKKSSFICLCFDERLLSGGKPDMLIICRSVEEQEEIIRRVLDGDERKVFIKRW